MFRGTDSRNADAEFGLVRSVLAGGERLLCHGELAVARVPAPKGALSAFVESLAVMGALVVTDVDESQVRLRWDDVYTVGRGEDVTLMFDAEEVAIRSAVGPGFQPEITEFFARLGWMSDLLDGRKLVIGEANVKTVEWEGPETGPVDDAAIPSYELVGGLEKWLMGEAGFVDNEFPTNYIRPISDEVGLCVGVGPQAFKMENFSRRHPVVGYVGVAHRPLNEFSDWLGSRPHRPWRWTLHEPVRFFNPDAEWAWHADTSVDQAVGELEVALAAAERLVDPEVLAEFLWRDDRFVRAFYQRARIAFHLVNGWGEAGEAELAAWRETTSSPSRVTLAEATLRKYLESGDTPYYFETQA